MTDRRRPSVLVIGAGSIGSRHARNLAALGAHVSISDPDPHRAAAVPAALVVPFATEKLVAYDGVIIASPTRFHRSQVEHALSGKGRVLVEKPMALTGAEADELVTLGGDRLAVAYNLRFHEPVYRLISMALGGDAGAILGARLWFGSYLPDWRPHDDYRAGYSARAELGGGVLFDAIHEIDLAVWLLGPELRVVGAAVTKVSDLEIDVEDTAKALLQAPSGVVVDVSLDYLSRRYRRGIEVVGSDATLRLDWARAVIEREDANGVETFDATTPIDQSYERQASAFVDWIEGRGTMPVDAATGAVSTRIADEIRLQTFAP